MRVPSQAGRANGDSTSGGADVVVAGAVVVGGLVVSSDVVGAAGIVVSTEAPDAAGPAVVTAGLDEQAPMARVTARETRLTRGAFTPKDGNPIRDIGV
jgi:hypothetical protein